MNRKISVSMAVTIAIIAMTVTFSVTMVLAMRLFDDTVSSVNEKESQYTFPSWIAMCVTTSFMPSTTTR